MTEQMDIRKKKSLRDKAEVNGGLHEKVWKEAAGLRKSGKLLERFGRISCLLVLIQGAVDPHPPEGVIQPLRDRNVDIKSYMFLKWGRGYAKRLNSRVVRNCMNMVLKNKPLEHGDFSCTSGLLLTQSIAAVAYCL